MFLNVPNNFTKQDVVKHGIIHKDKNYYYILSDLKNRNKDNVIKLASTGFYSYIYNVYDSYLFIIGNQIKNKDINPKSVDFLSKILKFEYMLQNKNRKIQKINIPSKIFTITTQEKWLQDDLLNNKQKDIDYIIKHKKTHLQAYESLYELYMMYLCDNPIDNMGVFEHGLCKNLLLQDYIYILKDVNIDGYIIKTDNSKFL